MKNLIRISVPVFVFILIASIVLGPIVLLVYYANTSNLILFIVFSGISLLVYVYGFVRIVLGFDEEGRKDDRLYTPSPFFRLFIGSLLVGLLWLNQLAKAGNYQHFKEILDPFNTLAFIAIVVGFIFLSLFRVYEKKQLGLTTSKIKPNLEPVDDQEFVDK